MLFDAGKVESANNAFDPSQKGNVPIGAQKHGNFLVVFLDEIEAYHKLRQWVCFPAGIFFRNFRRQGITESIDEFIGNHIANLKQFMKVKIERSAAYVGALRHISHRDLRKGPVVGKVHKRFPYKALRALRASVVLLICQGKRPFLEQL